MQIRLIQIKFTLVRNGSDKIGGASINASLTTEGLAVTLVFMRFNTRLVSNRSGLQ